ncbi:nucleotidyltransferase domain-containing protein [Candidatus Gastranaerophilales bacterium]|nr:MAG: nucleotidyltransferase domain-containing protein [Candidatus Gastranaerophilales bacterium]
MIKGISEKEEKIIKNILAKYPYDFYAYGSRVKGDFTRASDLDILLMSDGEILQSDIEKIKNEFNESKVPYRVNISRRDKMEDYFFKLIEADLVKV